MNFSTANLSKSTPRVPRAIGNAVVFMCLAIQPLITQADDKDMPHKTKFWVSIIISALGSGVKGFTMMLSEDEKNENSNGK